MEHRPTFTVLREQPDVRRQVGIAIGALLAAFGVHTWSSTALMTGGVSSMGAADAGFYSGVLSAAVFLAAALVVGWIWGGWILESGADQGMEAKEALRRTVRRLAVIGCLLIAGIASGASPLAGGLIIVVGSGAGLIARNTFPDRPYAC